MTDPGIIYSEKPQQCDLCGEIAELRPYGPKGEAVCFDCAMEDEPSALEKFRERMGWATAHYEGE